MCDGSSNLARSVLHSERLLENRGLALPPTPPGYYYALAGAMSLMAPLWIRASGRTSLARGMMP